MRHSHHGPIEEAPVRYSVIEGDANQVHEFHSKCSSPRGKSFIGFELKKAPGSNVKEMKKYIDICQSLTNATSSDPPELTITSYLINFRFMENEFKKARKPA
jgi:hypothetical protein